MALLMDNRLKLLGFVNWLETHNIMTNEDLRDASRVWGVSMSEISTICGIPAQKRKTWLANQLMYSYVRYGQMRFQSTIRNKPTESEAKYMHKFTVSLEQLNRQSRSLSGQHESMWSNAGGYNIYYN